MNDLERDLVRNDAFEAAVFGQAVATARRTRRTRTLTRAAAVTALCLVTLQLSFRHKSDSPTFRPQIALQENVPAAPPRSFQIFRSTTFAGKIQTTPLSPGNSLATKHGQIAIVRTSNLEQPQIARINDDELLSLFQGKPVALVGRGANAQLIIPDTSPGN